MLPKRAAAINDISGAGRCSLTVALPVISAMGHQVCPVPTAVLSAHTGFPYYSFTDLSDFLQGYLDSWDDIGFTPDAVYTGFLGSEKQIEPVIRYLEKHENALKLVDPVMGDDGLVYKTYTEKMCREMASLCSKADVITPNLTEACILTGLSYPQNPTEEDIKKITEALKKTGAKAFVLTGVKVNGALKSCCFDGARDFEVIHRDVDIKISGTGDLFASALLGRLLSGYTLEDAVASAGDFVSNALEYTKSIDAQIMHGVVFEPLLKTL